MRLCNTATVVCNQDFKRHCIQATEEKKEHFGCIDLFPLCAARPFKRSNIICCWHLFCTAIFILKMYSTTKWKNWGKNWTSQASTSTYMILAFPDWLHSHAQSCWCFICTKSLDPSSFTGTAISLNRNIYRSTEFVHTIVILIAW